MHQPRCEPKSRFSCVNIVNNPITRTNLEIEATKRRWRRKGTTTAVLPIDVISIILRTHPPHLADSVHIVEVYMGLVDATLFVAIGQQITAV